MKKIISITKLNIDKHNVRQTWVSDKDFIDSIKTQGIIEDLIVRKAHPDEKVEYTIVVGGRRFNAAIEAGLMEVPCDIRELTNLEALGMSLQENLQRKNLDVIQISKAIRNIWDMLEGISYNKKIQKCENLFGLKSRQISSYLSISKLPNDVKGLFLPQEKRNQKLKDKIKEVTVPGTVKDKKLSIRAATKISSVLKGVNDKNKFRVAANILDKSREERDEMIRKIKKSKKPIKKAIEETRKTVDRGYHIKFNSKITEALKKACIKENKQYTIIINDSVKEYLKKRGYL